MIRLGVVPNGWDVWLCEANPSYTSHFASVRGSLRRDSASLESVVLRLANAE